MGSERERLAERLREHRNLLLAGSGWTRRSTRFLVEAARALAAGEGEREAESKAVVRAFFDGRHQAICGCGWSGAKRARWAAEADARNHICPPAAEQPVGEGEDDEAIMAEVQSIATDYASLRRCHGRGLLPCSPPYAAGYLAKIWGLRQARRETDAMNERTHDELVEPSTPAPAPDDAPEKRQRVRELVAAAVEGMADHLDPEWRDSPSMVTRVMATIDATSAGLIRQQHQHEPAPDDAPEKRITQIPDCEYGARGFHTWRPTAGDNTKLNCTNPSCDLRIKVVALPEAPKWLPEAHPLWDDLDKIIKPLTNTPSACYKATKQIIALIRQHQPQEPDAKCDHKDGHVWVGGGRVDVECMDCGARGRVVRSEGDE